MSLKSLLSEYSEYPALAVNWIMFGASGRRERPSDGGALRWYSQCTPTPHPTIKTIVNTKHVEPATRWPHPHNMYYKCAASNFTLLHSVCNFLHLLTEYVLDYVEELLRMKCKQIAPQRAVRSEALAQ